MTTHDDRLDKLRRLILHDHTPAAERSAALRRLERVVGGEVQDKALIQISRSSRVSRTRHRGRLSEFDRIETFSGALSYGACIDLIVRACAAGGWQPTAIDFGHEADGPMIAIYFGTQELPDLTAFREALALRVEGARVTLGNLVTELGERCLLIRMPPDSGIRPANTTGAAARAQPFA